jgi:hypothetical protein
VDNSYADFEWDGKDFKKRIEELIDRTPIPQAAPPTNAAAPVAPAAAAAKNLSTSHTGPGQDVGGGYKACSPDDSSPSGAVVDGMKKVVTATPFGSGCTWEPVK